MRETYGTVLRNILTTGHTRIYPEKGLFFCFIMMVKVRYFYNLFLTCLFVFYNEKLRLLFPSIDIHGIVILLYLLLDREVEK